MRPRLFSDEDLFRVARECFLEHGADVSTSVIAERLGVSHAALFKRVGNKEALLKKALLERVSPPYLSLLEQEPDERPVREQLLEIATTIDAFLRQHLPVLGILLGRGRAVARRMLAEVETPPARTHKAIASWLRALERQGRVDLTDPEALALMLFSSLEARHLMSRGLGLHYPDGGPDYVAFVVDHVCAVIVPPQKRRDGRSPSAGRAGGKRRSARSKR